MARKKTNQTEKKGSQKTNRLKVGGMVSIDGVCHRLVQGDDGRLWLEEVLRSPSAADGNVLPDCHPADEEELDHIQYHGRIVRQPRPQTDIGADLAAERSLFANGHWHRTPRGLRLLLPPDEAYYLAALMDHRDRVVSGMLSLNDEWFYYSDKAQERDLPHVSRRTRLRLRRALEQHGFLSLNMSYGFGRPSRNNPTGHHNHRWYYLHYHLIWRAVLRARGTEPTKNEMAAWGASLH